MKILQKLTVNGDTYTVSDPNAIKEDQLTTKIVELIDKLCQSFGKTGSAVRCEPVEGYPLKVVTELPTSDANGITLYVCGKNLFDYTNPKYTFKDSMILYDSGYNADSSSHMAVLEHMPIGHLKGQTITLNHPPAEKATGTVAGLAFYDANKKYISGSNSYTHIVPDNAEYVRFSIPRELKDGTKVTPEDIQIELGSVVTDFEPYRDPIQYTADATGMIHEWSGVKAIAGVNTIWSNVGTTSVTGKANPIAIIDGLSREVAELKETVAALLEG